MGKLQGKVAVVTSDEAVTTIGSNVSGIQGDVTKLGDLDRLYKTVAELKGRIDIVFANAGVGEFGSAVHGAESTSAAE